MKRDASLDAKYTNDAAHRITSNNLSDDAVETEIPTPVPMATYAARHAGHFGKTARIVPGTSHPAMPRERRTNVGLCGSSPVVPPTTISGHELLEETSQQR